MARGGRGLMGVAVAAALVAGACGGDDDGEAASGQLREYCDAVLAVENPPFPDIDFESMSPEQQAAAVKEFATGTIRPLANRVVAAAPEDLADEIAVLDKAVTELEQTGDFEGVFNKPEVEEASTKAHSFDLKNCGWDKVDVEAADYKFEGVPRKVDAGVVSFEMTNKGKELHEMVILRKNDGVTEPFDQLLELPEEEAMEKTTFVAATQGMPDEKGVYTVADLQPGSYIMVCFIPQGTVSEEPSEDTEAPPHVALGMKQEFTVEA